MNLQEWIAFKILLVLRRCKEVSHNPLLKFPLKELPHLKSCLLLPIVLFLFFIVL